MYSNLELLAPDSLLGLTRLFTEDPRRDKIDLGVGVFRTPDNRTPVMRAVKEAEKQIIERQETKSYIAPEGAPGFGDALMRLVFGDRHEAVRDGRCAVMQTAGGCGALRIAAEFLRRAGATAVHSGSPTWPNHQPLLTAAGLKVALIPYYDAARSEVDFDAFMAGVSGLGANDVLLLHGVCHNPTGADLNPGQIDAVFEAAERQGFLPFIDMAYHGFAEGLEVDARLAREAARRLPEAIVTYSCSKNFGLYRERTGALFVIGDNKNRAAAAQSHIVNLARGLYSMPPAHGGAIVAHILQSAELTASWKTELAAMRDALRQNRELFVATAAAMGFGNSVSFIKGQNGMFSLLPLSEVQVLDIRKNFGIYMANSGRVNMCGVNSGNVELICNAYQSVT